MFASRNEDVLFMETAMHLARQRRHCLIECIPVPPDVAKQAPLYFKKVKGFAKDKNIGVDSVLNVIFYRQLMRLKMNGVSIMQKS